MKSKKMMCRMFTVGLLAAALLTGLSAKAEGGDYSIHEDHWSREDFSQEANPAVFTDVYDRELYNAIRQAIVDGSGETPAYTMVSKEDYSAVKKLLGRMNGALYYEHYVPESFRNYCEYLDYFAVSAEIPEQFQSALEFIQPVIDTVSQLETEQEKAVYLNDCLRSLLRYDEESTSGITKTFSPHTGELPAACGSYAKAYKFLCSAAGIPCITITTETHGWNLVYVDEKWLHVDVSSNDNAGRNHILLAEELPNRADTTPEATEFLKELLVPGSTK